MVQDGALYKCHLLLIEDLALEAQPRHKVADGVGQNLLSGHAAVGSNAYFYGIHCLLKIPWVRRQSYGTVTLVRCGSVHCCCVVGCNPQVVGDGGSSSDSSRSSSNSSSSSSGSSGSNSTSRINGTSSLEFLPSYGGEVLPYQVVTSKRALSKGNGGSLACPCAFSLLRPMLNHKPSDHIPRICADILRPMPLTSLLGCICEGRTCQRRHEGGKKHRKQSPKSGSGQQRDLLSVLLAKHGN